jgi:hypothetical protein
VLAAAPDRAPDAARLAVRLRSLGALAVLESGFGRDEAVARAEAAGIPRVVVVGGPDDLALHDLVTLSESACTPAQLDRLARDEARPR